jgi:hypothetical protein
VIFGALALGVTGALLSLLASLPAVIVGLSGCAASAFICQSASTSHLRIVAPTDVRGPASGVYISVYYIGGSVGGVLPAAAWSYGGWPACVALVIAVQLITLVLALSLKESVHVEPLDAATVA